MVTLICNPSTQEAKCILRIPNKLGLESKTLSQNKRKTKRSSIVIPRLDCIETKKKRQKCLDFDATIKEICIQHTMFKVSREDVLMLKVLLSLPGLAGTRPQCHHV